MPTPRRSQRNAAASSTRSSQQVDAQQTPAPKRRCSQRTRQSPRGNAGFAELAQSIVGRKQNVVFITGAGLSVASGVRPFRTSGSGGRKNARRSIETGLPPLAGIWDEVVYMTATRAAFRKDPLRWYNEFWIPHFYITGSRRPVPNSGHLALNALIKEHSNIFQVTQK